MGRVFHDGPQGARVSFRIYQGDALAVLRTLPSESVHCCVTSPPYWGLRDYGVTGQLGLERTPEKYLARLVAILDGVRRVLRLDGTLWVNIGDSYANDGKWGGQTGGKHASALHGESIGRGKRDTGLKPKQLVMIPARLALALQAAGWWLRSDIIWAKPAPMPESVTDRPTRSHEYIFLLANSEKYYYDHEAIKEPAVCDHASGNGYKRESRLSFLNETGARGSDEQWKPKGKGGKNAFRGQGHFRDSENGPANREGRDMRDVGASETCNKRDVWTVNTKPFPGAHFATFPEELIEPCIKAGCPAGGTVLDPFAGACTTGLVAEKWGRNSELIELNPAYCEMGRKRLENFAPLFRDSEHGPKRADHAPETAATTSIQSQKHASESLF